MGFTYNVCGEIKTKFRKPPIASLIKAPQTIERLSLDLKVPLPSRGKYIYVLTIVDEYSRYPFAFPCSNIDSKVVINCLSQIFTLFGACSLFIRIVLSRLCLVNCCRICIACV